MSAKRMDALMRIIMWRYAASVIFFALFVPSAFAATQKNVLILHEGSRLLTYQFRLSREMQKDLASKKFDIQIFEEYLDSWHLTQDPKYALEALEAKYAGLKFDVVVVDGNTPFQTLLNQPPAFLRGTPVVFLTVPDYDVPPRLPANVTGVTVHKEYGAAVRLAATLQPGLRHVFYVEGGLGSNTLRDASLRRELASFNNQLEIVSLENLTVDELLNRVKSLPPRSAILFDSYLKDPAGKAYVPGDVADLIAKSANAPVYALFDTTVGGGALGGVVIGFDAIGKQAAGIVLGLLAGAPVSRYPVEHSHNQIMIDWNAFQRFGLSESRLPSSAIVLDRPPTAWEKYREYLIAAGVVILLQTVLIIELGLAVKLRKRSERTARELATRLINAQEEERRRLAGELHDDVSQRLALVAVHLDSMRRSPPLSRKDLVRELSVLYDETDLISTDIHQFSHELHPAILERLGLASALRRYCAEFSAHRRIAVHMSTAGEESRLNRETALAFFRIGQECLMNAAKHSGAADCKVSLIYAHGRIKLAVEDNGRGFEATRARAETGLGIQSMRERLRSIDGTLRIQSSALQGTTVIAEARLRQLAMPDEPEFILEETSDAQSEVSAD